MSISTTQFVILGVAAFALTGLLTWPVRALAIRLGAMDAPNLARKTQTEPVPYLGGVAIALGISLITLGAVFVGADNFDPQAIKAVAGLRQGQKITIPGDKISEAIKNLWKEELFSNVAINLDKEIDGIVYLTIHLTPRPKLSHFKFKGVPKREADKLRDEITLFSGKTITENLLFQTEAKIRGYFREKGFYTVDVTIKRVKDTIMNNSEIFVIDINRYLPDMTQF